MNRDRPQGYWMRIVGGIMLPARNPDPDSTGLREWLAGEVLKRRDHTTQEAERQLKDFLHRNRDWRKLSGG